MKNALHLSKIMLILGGLAFVVLGFSYLEESKYRKFETQTRALQVDAPFMRIIGTGKSADLASPWSWFYARTHLITFALPDPVNYQYFQVLSFQVDDPKPNVSLVQPDCATQKIDWFREQDGKNEGDLALNIFGEPILSKSGSPFVRITQFPAPKEWLDGLCNHDWKIERHALAMYMKARKPTAVSR